MSILGAPAWLAAFIIASSMLLACLGACALSGRISRREEEDELRRMLARLDHHVAELGDSSMALATGHVLLNTTAKGDGPLAQDLAAVGREMARLFEEVGAALSDGTIQASEAAQIEARAMDGVNALVSVIAETRRIRGRGKS